MIRTVLIDDEANGRNTLLVQRHCPTVEIVATADSCDTGVQCLEEHRPDLVFLDIEMPLGSGFDILERLRDRRFELIFTTAHSEYACRAFRANALDYLLKPIHPDNLLQAACGLRRVCTGA